MKSFSVQKSGIASLHVGYTPAALCHLNNFESLTKNQTWDASCSLALLPATHAVFARKTTVGTAMSQRASDHRANLRWFSLLGPLALLFALFWSERVY